LGIDASYWFGFECYNRAVQRIISNLQLKPDREFIMIYDMKGNIPDSMPDSGNRLYGGLNSNPAAGWDTAFINKPTPYGKIKGGIHWYLWYNPIHKKVYFLAFDV